MRIKQVEVFAVRLSLREPFRSAKGVVGERELGILRLTDEDGRIGLGEVTPYPGPGSFSLEPALAELGAVLASAQQGLVIDEDEPELPAEASPPVLAALDSALLDLRARRRGLRVAELLGAQAVESVPVNATITALEPSDVAQQARRACAEGYATVKLKVGFAGLDEQRLAALREAVGFELLVRLDANGAWSADEAIEQVTRLQGYGLELIEQPVPPGDLSAMRHVREAASVPIVADEGVRTLPDLEAHIAAGACDGIAVKLSQVGGPTAAGELVRRARQAGLLAFVTSTLDGPIGLAAGLHFAAAEADFGLANGLATADLLKRTYASGLPPVEHGAMVIGDVPGLGIELDEDALAEFAIH